LVIAPILGNGVEGGEMKKECTMDVKMECKGDMIGKCDMSKCKDMTKEECAAMCDSLKCTPEQKEACLSHYGADGKFIAEKKDDCCAKKGMKIETPMGKEVRVEITNTNGKAKATVTTTVNGTSATETFEGTEAEVKAKVAALK
jgi:K(+)-stimulated pyrophosphate-energized sodium pump